MYMKKEKIYIKLKLFHIIDNLYINTIYSYLQCIAESSMFCGKCHNLELGTFAHCTPICLALC